MNINGKEYVEAEKIERLKQENQSIKLEKESLAQILRLVLPIDEKEIERITGMSLQRLKVMIKWHSDSWGDNERLRYEKKIAELQDEIAGLKSNMSKIKNQLRNDENGKVKMTACEKRKLLDVQKILNEILE